MNTTDIFRYIKERLESDSKIQEIVKGKIYPIAIMRNVKAALYHSECKAEFIQ